MAQARSFLSPDWYRVAGLRPRLRGQVEIHRQVFRGDVWYVIQDHASGRYHRVTPAANLMIALMDGRRSVAQLWELACSRFPDSPPTQPEVIRLLSQLHTADLVAVDMPNIGELAQRHAKQSAKALMARIRNPLAMRFPLVDPDRFLDATVGLVRPLFSWAGLVLWLLLVGIGAALAVMHWDALTENLADRVLTAENLLVLAVAFPLLKAVHELGHAYATKIWGGEVHEIGLMLLVLMPVPFVDATASNGFASKWQRAVVGGAGIMVELAVAAAALVVWVNVEPGFVRALAFNLALIGGVSSLLFNGNPLLKFDGYYVFSDLIEIPGLGQRANQYVLHLIERHLLRVKDSPSPLRARGEAPIFFVYAILAFFYRMFIAIVIALFIASQFLVVGVFLALFALFNAFVLPLWKGVVYLATNRRLAGRRRRVTAGVGLAITGLAALVLFLPLPYATTAHGVVWLGEGAQLRAGAPGFVEEVAGHTIRLEGGAPVVTQSNRELIGQRSLAQARITETALRLNAAQVLDRAQAGILREQLDLARRQLEDIDSQLAALDITAPAQGRLVVPHAADLPGQLVRKGDVIGYFLDAAPLRLRVAVPQGQAELVRTRTQGVDLRFQRDLGTALPARLVGEVPQSQSRLPSLALAQEGGGGLLLDPARSEELGTLERVFLFDVRPQDERRVDYVGERALVRFDHGHEALAPRLWRAARQLFLSRFNV